MARVTIEMGRTSLMGLNTNWGGQKVTVSANHVVIWEGRTGDTAVLNLEGPTNLKIDYHVSVTNYPGHCTAQIDPAMGLHYQVKASMGAIGWNQKLQLKLAA